MVVAERVGALIQPALEEMGYELVRVHMSRGRPPVLQIMAERADRQGMQVEDCAVISRSVSALLDVEDPIGGSYHLEVSSPGIDRPLIKLSDYQRFAGQEARIEMREPVDGRKRFRGRLLGVDGENIVLVAGDPAGQNQSSTVMLPFRDVVRAKLVLTDELLALGQGKSQAVGQG